MPNQLEKKMFGHRSSLNDHAFSPSYHRLIADKALRAGWRRLVRVMNRIEHSWVGDLIGVVCLFALLWMLLLLGAAIE